MLLKSIEINGFKSFAKKSELFFNSSISAIVGPNGSGKSNVAEAFRFVWAADKDIFYYKKQSKVFEKISEKTGISVKKLNEELVLRSRLLYELYKKRIFSFDEMGRIISDYYKNPAEVLTKYIQ
jgi:chromosome segregation protein